MNKEVSRRQFLKLSGLFAVSELTGFSRGFTPAELHTVTFQSYLENIVQNSPEIGGYENYEKELGIGLGFATRHTIIERTAVVRGEGLRKWMRANKIAYADLNPAQKNIYLLTRRGNKSVEQSLTGNQTSPDKDLSTNQYSGGLIATRSPEDIGQKYLVFGVEKEERGHSIEYLGASLVVDCAAKKDWNGRLAHWRYTHKGWDLPWIADVSDELMKRLPPGMDSNKNNLNQGRPGLLLVSEENFHRFHHFQNQPSPNKLF